MPITVRGRAVSTSLGHDADDLLDALLAGRVGATAFEHPDADHMRTRIAHDIPEAPGDPGPFRPRRASSWVTALLQAAIADAGGLDAGDRRVAVVLGTGQRELNSVELWASGRGPAVSADELSYRRAVTKAVGPVRFLSVLGACAAGMVALGIATDLLNDDDADIVIVVSVEPLHATVGAMYDRVATRIATEIRPFDEDRVGTIFGAGAAAVVLQRVTHPNPADIIVRGVGFSSDARRSAAPDPDGISAAIDDAHRRAEVSGRDIDLVLAHGTGTKQNDDAEAEALTRANCTRAQVTSIKPMIGHTLASSGLISFIVAVGCLRRGVVPATLNLTTKAAAARALTIPTTPVSQTALRYAQIDAFGFGGINAVAILERAA